MNHPVTSTFASKRRFFAWRSWQNAERQRAADDSAPISIGSDEGDICPIPSPIPLRP